MVTFLYQYFTFQFPCLFFVCVWMCACICMYVSVGVFVCVCRKYFTWEEFPEYYLTFLILILLLLRLLLVYLEIQLLLECEHLFNIGHGKHLQLNLWKPQGTRTQFTLNLKVSFSQKSVWGFVGRRYLRSANQIFVYNQCIWVNG